MVETVIGNFTLTERQKYRVLRFRNALIEAVSVLGDKVVVYGPRALTAGEIQTVSDALNALPDDPTPEEQDRIDFQTNPLKGKTAAQVNDWIDANVTDLASTKTALKHLARAVLFLTKRSDLNQ